MAYSSYYQREVRASEPKGVFMGKWQYVASHKVWAFFTSKECFRIKNKETTAEELFLQSPDHYESCGA